MTSAPGEDVPLRVLDFASLYPSVAVFKLGLAAADTPAGRRATDAAPDTDGVMSPEKEWRLNNPAAAAGATAVEPRRQRGPAVVPWRG